jgi:hypothetical protein
MKIQQVDCMYSCYTHDTVIEFNNILKAIRRADIVTFVWSGMIIKMSQFYISLVVDVIQFDEPYLLIEKM